VKTTFRKSFARDLKKIKDHALLDRVKQTIDDLETAVTPQHIGDLKKMGGTQDFYRIHIGEYRIGAQIQGDSVLFLRCLPRRDLYRFFP
jgi:mRNA interferase RelE/StbE